VSTKNGEKVKKSFKRDQFHTTVDRLLLIILEDISTMSLHLFNVKWQARAFEQAKTNLKPGSVTMVCDFGTNFSHHYNEEIQSVFWSRKQLTNHNSVLFYKCPQCADPVWHEITIFSEDLHHDSWAVKEFTKIALDCLRELRMQVDKVIRFSDNCAGQYKSCHAFAMFSQEDIRLVVSYLGSKHGKNDCDGIGGRTMQILCMGIKTEPGGIPDTSEAVVAFLKKRIKQLEDDKIKSGDDVKKQ